MTGQWADVPADVLAHYVAALLVPLGRHERIRELLTSMGYVAEKAARVGVAALLDDLRIAREHDPAPLELAPLELALTEAEQILRDDPGQLRAQLLARVPRTGAADVARMLDEAAGWRAQTWWRPAGTIHNHGYLAAFGPVRGFVDAVAISDDGSLLLAGDRDGNLYAWDLRDRQLIWQGEAGSPVNAVVFRPGSFEALVGLDDGGVGRWSLADRRLRIEHNTGRYAVSSLDADAGTVVFGAGPMLHALGGHDWAVDTGQEVVTAVAIAGAHCVSGGRDGSVVVSRLADGGEVRRAAGTVDRVLCLAAIPGTGTVVVGGKDKRVATFDVATAEVRVLGRHSNQVRAAAALDAGRVVTGSYDGQVLVWDLAERKSSRVGRHNGWCLSVAAPRDGGPVAVGSDDKRLRLWNPDRPLAADLGKAVRAVLVVDGIAYGGTDRAVLRAGVDDGRELPRLRGHKRQVEVLVRTPTGLATGSGDATIRLWDLGIGEARVLSGHRRGIQGLAVTPDGSELVSVSSDGTWRRWDATTGRAGPVVEGRDAYTDVLALSPDGALVVTATTGHVVEVWDRVSGRPALPPLIGHDGYVQALGFTPDGGTLVSGSWDRTLRFWRVTDGEPLGALAFDEWIVDLAVTADGRLLAAYCASGSIALVDPATREIRSTLDLGDRAYGELALSEDDRTLFALRGYELQAWDIDSATMLARFDADLPLRSLATAGPETVVVGTDIGTLVPMRLISRLG